LAADAFEKAFRIVVGHEGGFDTTRADPGNWTSGIVGVGVLLGTKYGVSAAAYPDVAIADLTLDQAQTIYRRDYWDRIGGDGLPPSLALLVFDAAINNGAAAAARWLQATVGADQDGRIGPVTRAAAAACVAKDGAGTVGARFQGRRVFFMGCLSTWPVFGHGWAERLCLLPYQSITMTEL
jgi:lysozyme family protein